MSLSTSANGACIEIIWPAFSLNLTEMISQQSSRRSVARYGGYSRDGGSLSLSTSTLSARTHLRTMLL